MSASPTAMSSFDIPSLAPHLMNISKYLHLLIKSENLTKRLEGFSQKKSYALDISTAFAEAIATAQKKQLPDLVDKEIDADEKNSLLRSLNASLNNGSQFVAMSKCCIDNALKGVGACQEFGLLSALYLFKLFGIGEQRAFNVEAGIIYLRRNKASNHQFIILNRVPDSNFSDISTWGKDCYIFDPQNQWFANARECPIESSLSSYSKHRLMSGYALEFDFSNDFLISAVPTLKAGHVLSKIREESCFVLHDFIERALDDLVTSLGFPPLPPEITFIDAPRSTMVDKLEKLAGSQIKFNLGFDRQYYAHAYARINSDKEQAIAEKMTGQLQYGSIMSIKDNRYLMFGYINSEERCFQFREKMRRIDTDQEPDNSLQL